ncbi:tRNA lysidine(34) synthetase TilS [Ciceribacter sp. L1K23]|uniref:tRNA lysidine(34) synthetase TilS n=1 Tax=Ciceribacter sp. L1K23 TaxID=2820276 RepID=UPI001B838AF0|nr:tRNA lysidine(34) synthetase TilS [Ciceribacter sp. L1K23]
MPAALPPRQALSDFLTALRKPRRLLVAISGGSDSTGLLFLLHDLVSTGAFPGIMLLAATVDHQLRPEARAEAESVGRFCAGLSIAHRILSWDGAKPARGVPAAAREARYRLLSEMAKAEGVDVLVTGHTLDDQRETVAMRKARSALPDSIGLAGMSGMTLYERHLWIARPLLGSLRSDIREQLRQADVGWIEDPSNQDGRYERVRVRSSLMAATTEEGADRLDERRSESAQSAAALISAHATGHAGPSVFFSARALREPDDSLRRAFGGLLMVLGGQTYPPARERLDRVMDFLRSGRSGRATIGRCLLVWRPEGLYITREKRDILPLLVPARQSVVWDGRFIIRNRSSKDVTVTANQQGVTEPVASSLPKTIIKHISGILPEIIGSDDTENANKSGEQVRVDCEIVLGGYDRFLPDADRPLADAIAVLLGRPRYLTPPV